MLLQQACSSYALKVFGYVIKLLLNAHFTQPIKNIFGGTRLIRPNLPLSHIYYVFFPKFCKMYYLKLSTYIEDFYCDSLSYLQNTLQFLQYNKYCSI